MKSMTGLINIKDNKWYVYFNENLYALQDGVSSPLQVTPASLLIKKCVPGSEVKFKVTSERKENGEIEFWAKLWPSAVSTEPTPKNKARKLYRDAYMRWCYELSHDKNVATAKNICEYICNEVLGDMGADRGYEFWVRVKREITEGTHEDLYKEED